jgi:PPOX class probable F420-dependent enzyme
MPKRVNMTATEIAFAHEQRVARMATADEDGNPTLVPVCYAFDEQYFYTPLDEKPKGVDPRQLRRIRNITARPSVALLIDLYSDNWSQLAYLLIYAHAQVIEPSHSLHSHSLTLLRARYLQYHSMQLELLPVILLTPQHITSWGKPLQS